MKLARALGTLLLALTSVSVAFAKGTSDASSEHWVATWSTALDLARTVSEKPVVPPGLQMPDFSKLHGPRPRISVPPKLEDETIRMIVHASIGGKRVRIQLSSAEGKNAVTIGAAHIALRSNDSAITTGSDRTLTFGGNPSITLQPGVLILSDPVDLDVKPFSDLAVSLYLPTNTGLPTSHPLGLHKAYIAKGDATGSGTLSETGETYSYLWLAGVDVVAPVSAFTIVAFGDSITDGFCTTNDANMAWPSLLAEGLSRNKAASMIAVVNKGISGNEVLKDGAGVSALARFDRDVLSTAGVKWVIVLEGINDINIHGQVDSPDALTAGDLIVGYKQIIERAHTYGIRVVGATIMAEEGVWLSTPIGERKRQAVNEWIRSSHAFDKVVDLDEVTSDPQHRSALRKAFDSGDHIHPNDAGNKAMAEAFDLSVFN